MNCARCGQEAQVLYRANEIGDADGVWWCEKCAQELEVDPEVKRLAEIISKGKPPAESDG